MTDKIQLIFEVLDKQGLDRLERIRKSALDTGRTLDQVAARMARFTRLEDLMNPPSRSREQMAASKEFADFFGQQEKRRGSLNEMVNNAIIESEKKAASDRITEQRKMDGISEGNRRRRVERGQQEFEKIAEAERKASKRRQIASAQREKEGAISSRQMAASKEFADFFEKQEKRRGSLNEMVNNAIIESERKAASARIAEQRKIDGISEGNRRRRVESGRKEFENTAEAERQASKRRQIASAQIEKEERRSSNVREAARRRQLQLEEAGLKNVGNARRIGTAEEQRRIAAIQHGASVAADIRQREIRGIRIRTVAERNLNKLLRKRAAGRAGFAGRAMVAGGALSALTGNFAFLGPGFAAMSGDEPGAAAVAVATGLNMLGRAAFDLERSFMNAAKAKDFLTEKNMKFAKELETHMKALGSGRDLMNLERAKQIRKEGGSISPLSEIGTGFRTGLDSLILGAQSKEVKLGMDIARMSSAAINPMGQLAIEGIIKFIGLAQSSGQAHRELAEANKLLVWQEKRRKEQLEAQKKLLEVLSKKEEQLENARDRLASGIEREFKATQDKANSIRASVDKDFALNQRALELQDLISRGFLEMEIGAKALFRSKGREVKDDTFSSAFVGLEEMSRRMQEATASRFSKEKDEPTKEDIEEMRKAILSASSAEREVSKSSAREIVDAITALQGGMLSIARVGLP